MQAFYRRGSSGERHCERQRDDRDREPGDRVMPQIIETVAATDHRPWLGFVRA